MSNGERVDREWGSFDKVCTKSNGKFLGLIEMMASFDDIMAEHIRRINNQEIHDH
ncbi:zinc finger MYM-type protein 1-like [Aphis craccivora]|uniref:Zinc finger MYM-type protein 1-like n=1 Tax=Aphis craccivora TaxID=307492 RepID=A0A6G0VQ70_APHCR|nr:zinc finger MYM-type protein 1-like [Aphis craccivora]